MRPQSIPRIIAYWQTPRYSRFAVWIVLPSLGAALQYFVRNLPEILHRLGLV